MNPDETEPYLDPPAARQAFLFDGRGLFLAGGSSGTTVASSGDDPQTGREPRDLAALVGSEVAQKFFGAGPAPSMTTILSAEGERPSTRLELRWLEGPGGQFIVATIWPADLHPFALRDALTGLPDRRAIAAWFEDRTRRHGRHSSYVALFLDLDHFKEVNDRHGHAAGDAALVELARRWGAAVRDDDLAVRYGGDEFVILLDGVATTEGARPIVDRLLRATQEPIAWQGRLISVSATVGAAVGENSSDVREVIARADAEMYAQKQARPK
jgi:diguanylate cyclase (GGDEF)-like protein